MARPEVLYIAHRVPFPPDKGDRIRSYHVLRWLAKRAAVSLACLADEPTGPGVESELRRLCKRLAVVPNRGPGRWARALASLASGRSVTEGAFASAGLRAIIRRWAGEASFRAALASSSGVAPYLRMRALRHVPPVVDLVDVDSEKWFEYAAAGRGPKAWLHRLEGRRVRRLERGLPGWAEAITLVSEPEATLYRRACGEGPVHGIPNGVALDDFRHEPGAEERGCVFVGALDYRPNVEGAAWFSREAWPAIRQARPGATLALVGRRPAAAIQAMAEVPGVEVVGQVPDVRPHLACAAVVVVPLRIARGIQNKVLEALAMGKAVVASPQAVEGLRAEAGVHLLVASSPAEWVESVTRLLDDEPLRRRLGAAGRLYVEAHHDWATCLRPFGALLGLGDGADAASPVAPAPRDLSDRDVRPGAERGRR